MQYVKLGTTGLDVSPIAIGAMTFGEPERGHPVWSLGEEESRKLAVYQQYVAGIQDSLPVDAAAKPKIFQNLTLPALNWFRWSSLVTVFIGLWYWGQFLVAPDAERQGVGQGGIFGLFFLLWIGVWAILFFVIKKIAPSGYVLGVLTAILVYAAGYIFVNHTPVGGDDNHVLAIGVGGGMGIVMLFNVWGIIWPNNKKIIRGVLSGTPREDAATLARQAFLASRTNFFLSVPLIFYMAAASHFSSTAIFGK